MGDQRRRPVQARAKATRASILEAAVRLLQAHGAAGLNTNRIAERAGVSIGALYQYFPDKRAILVAAALWAVERELAGPVAALLEALARTLGGLLEGPEPARASRARRPRRPTPPSRGELRLAQSWPAPFATR